MKKVFKLSALLLTLIFVLTGCIDTQTAIKINKDDSADLTILIEIDKDEYKNLLSQFGGEEASDEDINSDIQSQLDGQADTYSQNGFTVEKIGEGNKLGIKVTKHFDSITKVSEATAEELQGLENLTVEEKDGKREFTANIDFSDVDDQTSAIMENFKYSFKLELPYRIEETNATEVSKDKKTLTWELDLTKNNEIYAKTTKLSKNAKGEYSEDMTTTIIIAGAVIAVVAVIGIIIVVARRNKKGEGEIEKRSDDKKEETVVETVPEPKEREIERAENKIEEKEEQKEEIKEEVPEVKEELVTEQEEKSDDEEKTEE